MAGDAASLSRAIVNLIQNAVIHGGSKTAIRVGVGRDGSLRVADTGLALRKNTAIRSLNPSTAWCRLIKGQGSGSTRSGTSSPATTARSPWETPREAALFEISLPVAGHGAL